MSTFLSTESSRLYNHQLDQASDHLRAVDIKLHLSHSCCERTTEWVGGEDGVRRLVIWRACVACYTLERRRWGERRCVTAAGG